MLVDGAAGSRKADSHLDELEAKRRRQAAEEEEGVGKLNPIRASLLLAEERAHSGQKRAGLLLAALGHRLPVPLSVLVGRMVLCKKG